jgi:23S rRNA (cytidine1920-2'-O)/16S rRNA (cytidine1409-2'-O)-methyltransferase
MTQKTPAAAPRDVGRAGAKLEAALAAFKLDVTGATCADFGSNVGGFVQVLLKHGAAKVFAIEKGYGVLDWSLRNDPHVVVMERTDAREIKLPEQVSLITADVGWTRLANIAPAIIRNLTKNGRAILLFKPQYEAISSERIGGRVRVEQIEKVRARLQTSLQNAGLTILSDVQSPLRGDKAGNPEWLLLVKVSV